ncbi:hypothetical protein Tco_1284840 [Tanacetum coccineum]
MSDSEHSTVTYTSVSFLVEDDSDIVSPGVEGPPFMPEDPYAYIMAAYEVPPSPDYIPGPEVPPSPDYIPGPEVPPSPDYIPGPEEPQSPPPLDFVPEPMYPEYMPQEDEILLAEEQPLPAAASPTADSPGYVPESDPEEEPACYITGAARQDGPVIARMKHLFCSIGGDLYGILRYGRAIDEIAPTTLEGACSLSFSSNDRDREAKMAHEAWGLSIDASDYARSDVMSLRTTIVAQSALISEHRWIEVSDGCIGPVKVAHADAPGLVQRTMKSLMKTKYCPRGEIKKLEFEMWNLKVKGNDVVTYSQRFQELALMMFIEFDNELMDSRSHLGGFNVRLTTKESLMTPLEQPDISTQAMRFKTTRRYYARRNGDRRPY